MKRVKILGFSNSGLYGFGWMVVRVEFGVWGKRFLESFSWFFEYLGEFFIVVYWFLYRVRYCVRFLRCWGKIGFWFFKSF